jgi:hypothetical protein
VYDLPGITSMLSPSSGFLPGSRKAHSCKNVGCRSADLLESIFEPATYRLTVMRPTIVDKMVAKYKKTHESQHWKHILGLCPSSLILSHLLTSAVEQPPWSWVKACDLEGLEDNLWESVRRFITSVSVTCSNVPQYTCHHLPGQLHLMPSFLVQHSSNFP